MVASVTTNPPTTPFTPNQCIPSVNRGSDKAAESRLNRKIAQLRRWISSDTL